MENSRGKQNGFVWGLWFGLSVLGGVSAYFGELSMMTMFAVPAVWAAMAFRTRPFLLPAAGILVFLFGYVTGFSTTSALCILGLVAPAGCILWFSQRERMGNFRSVLYMSVLLTFGLFLYFCLPDLMENGDPYVSIRTYFSAMSEVFEGTALYESSQQLASRIDELIVACFFAFAGVYALVNVLLLHAFNGRKKDMPLCPLGPFGTWFAPYGYVMIMGGLSLGSVLLVALRDTPALSALSLLLYEMWSLPLLVTGANVLYALLARRHPPGRRKLLFGLILAAGLFFVPLQFSQVAMMLLGFTGVIRRRRAGKERQ